MCLLQCCYRISLFLRPHSRLITLGRSGTEGFFPPFLCGFHSATWRSVISSDCSCSAGGCSYVKTSASLLRKFLHPWCLVPQEDVAMIICVLMQHILQWYLLFVLQADVMNNSVVCFRSEVGYSHVFLFCRQMFAWKYMFLFYRWMLPWCLLCSTGECTAW
jgi:hypothetical protein